MSAGTDASILGYGGTAPLSNINGQYVNTHNINDPAMFTDKTIPGAPGLAGASNNVIAASGKWMGAGGSRVFKRKIKNITKVYKKMRRGSRKLRSMKRRIRSRVNRRKTRRVRRRRQRGGTYTQYQSNVPNTPSYSVGGILSAGNLGQANPPPITRLDGNVNCADNYKH